MFEYRFRLLPVVMLLASLGCGRSTPEVPRIDASSAVGYEAGAFNDDAPMNARVALSDFPLLFLDKDGNAVDLSRYRTKKKIVLVVLRGIPRAQGGAFCPSCLAQVSSLTANRDELAQRGAEVLVVFPGPVDRLREFLQTVKNRTPGEPANPFQILLDQQCEACDRLGIRDDLAKPSTYILDTLGNVVYAHVGETSTDRPSIKAILAQIDKAQ